MQDHAQDQKQDTKGPTPLSREELKFVSAYRQYRYGGDGIYKAAEKARIPKNRAVRVFNKPEVQEEIDRQDEAVRQERAKLEAKDDELTVAFANRELMKTVQQLNTKEDAGQRLDALRLVYVVTGRIQMGNNRILETAPSGAEEEGAAPEHFDYRALIRLEPPMPIVPAAAHPEQLPVVSSQLSEKPIAPRGAAAAPQVPVNKVTAAPAATSGTRPAPLRVG